MMDWQIKPRAEQCSRTGRPFGDKEMIWTVLTEAPEGWVREDLCQEAWEQRGEGAAPVSCWQTLFRAGPPPAQEAVSRGDAESELRRLLGQGRGDQATTCHLLALMLERKRVLKLRERVERDGRRLALYEHNETQETFMVPEVDLPLKELPRLKEQLQREGAGLWVGEVPAGEAAVPPAPAV
jgi:hypothetical protein